MPMPKINKNPFNIKTTDNISEVLIYSDIGMWGITAENFIKSVELLKTSKKKIRINSYGGEVFDGFAIYNEIKKEFDNWVAEIDGVAASISSIIPLAAKTVKMRANAMMMIHNPSVMIAGDANDLQREADVLNKLKENSIDIYAQRMKGWSKEDISQLMNDETWYTAKEALDVGLIDEIIDPIEIEEPETNKSLKIPVDLGRKVFINYKQQKGVTMVKCPSCGKEHTEGSVYCSACGKPMDATLAMKEARIREISEAKEAERNRVSSIYLACEKHSIPKDFAESLINNGEEYEKCVVKILDKITTLNPVAPIQSTTTIVKDESEKFIAHATNSLLVMSGIERDASKIAESKKDVRISSLHSAMRLAMDKKGVSHSHLDAVGLTDETFRMIGTGSSDLPAALENIANKSLQSGYAEAPTTYQIWAARREVTDFKTNSIVDVSNFGDLKDLPEGAPFEDAKISDKKETYSISTKGRKWTASRNAFVNDDLDVFTKVQYKMGQAVGRGINRGFYDHLCANTLVGPTMGDSVALFNAASHYNLISDSGVVSVTSLSAARKALREMPLMSPEPGAGTQYANLTGRYLVTGTANEQSIEQVIGSGMDISKSIVGVYNPFTRQNTVLICDPYLQALLSAASKANAWYYVADQVAAETIGVAFLRGQTSPTSRAEASSVGQALGITYDIYLDWGFYVADHRGIIYNDGVTGS
jgi:ATP-dependent protease ClpP protease subunit